MTGEDELMRHVRIQRRLSESFITIEEFLLQTQPHVFKKLYCDFKLYIIDVTELVTAAADISGADKHYRNVMQERPKPGRGGLLPGEGGEDL